MIIKKVVVGAWRANCYIVVSENTGEGLIIDPGDSYRTIVEVVRTNNWQIKWLVATHGHIDHIGAIGQLRAVMNVPVAIHAQDSSALQGDSRFFWGEPFGPPLKADRLLSEGEIIKVAEMRFQVINTPGHTMGGICLYGHGILFTGDSLFRNSIGSSNIGTGTRLQLVKSIVEKLLTLPPDTVIYPGHGSMTTVGEEKQHNPFLYQRNNY